MADFPSAPALRQTVFVGVTWVLAAFAPVIASSPGEHIAQWWAVLLVTVACLALGLYDGMKAWRNGLRKLLVVRVLVPVGLLAASSLLYWLGLWQSVLSHVRSAT